MMILQNPLHAIGGGGVWTRNPGPGWQSLGKLKVEKEPPRPRAADPQIAHSLHTLPLSTAQFGKGLLLMLYRITLVLCTVQGYFSGGALLAALHSRGVHSMHSTVNFYW